MMIVESNLYDLIKQIMPRDLNGETELWLALIKRINDISSELGARLVVGYITASDWQMGKHYSNERILGILHDWDIPVIDMTLAAKPEKLSRQYFIHEQDMHPSAAANQARATLLAEYLKGRPVK